uniref:Uncharacterized protein n=1 Tax=Denticeps clupeoides TaxID=299321 RepID=A0AAY3ZVJ9_9TELE
MPTIRVWKLNATKPTSSVQELWSGCRFDRPLTHRVIHGGTAPQHLSWLPTLASSRADGNMIPFLNGPMDQNVVKSQAVQQDYKNFTQGHLNPNLHHRDQQDSEATFTLTNMVPQREDFNNGTWNVQEETVKKILIKYCKGPAYIITGIIPYKTERWIENRVAIPESSAYCCPDYSSKESNKFPTFAAIGRNDNKSTVAIVPVDKSKKGYNVRTMPLVELEDHLTQRFGTELISGLQRWY